MNIIFKSKKVVIAAVIILLAVVSIISAVIVNSASEGVKVSNKLKLGDRFLTELKYEDAVVAFKEVIEIEPRNIPAYLGIADAYVGLEQPAEAVAWLEKGIDETEKYYDETGELVADSEQLYLKDADILGDMGEYERAIDILERGQEITGDEAIEEKLEEIKSLLTVEATVASGSYDQTQLVELKSAGTRIYYTMDGSEPNQDSMYYEGPILIEFGSTTLKTVAEDEKGELGEVCSFTYEVGNGDLTETETAQNTPDSTPAEDIDIPDEDLLPEDTDLTEVDQNSETPTESPDNTDTAQEVITTDPVNPIATPIPDTNVIVTPKPVVTPTPKPLATPTPKPAATPTPVISKEPVLASESDFSYTVSDNGVSITKYTGKGGNIIIPDTLGGQKVTEIKREAFRKNLALIGITIPASVNAIETQAFYDTNIKTVTFKEGMTQIPAFALQDCESVETIMIPSTVTVIKGGTYAGAFDGCTNLKNIKLPKGLIEIGTNAFKNCSSLTEITIPSTVTKIGQFAFSGCKGLTAITIPASVTDMGGRVFKNT
ncbi:MAG: Ig-like surface protein, partial [Herbinix sp.]|nr:Ig-like surface protein [Herbinix sp.]